MSALEASALQANVQEALAAFAAALPPAAIQTAHEDIAPFLTDWRGTKTGRADALLLPASADQVQAIVRIACLHDVSLVPQGGNTGLVGGSVPEASSARPVVIVSTRRLRAIRSVDAAGLCLIAEAGAVLSDVHAAATAAGCVFPLSLGEIGRAHV